jgi:type VI secretion system secreted protein Hcp
MAVDMFLQLDPIKGESMDKDHKDQIDVLSWSWGMAQSGTTHLASGGGAGKVSVQDLSFTHYVDLASTYLMQACTKGQHISKGILTVRKAGGDAPLEYITITMEEVIVTNVHTGGSMGEERLTENVTLNFRKFKYQYAEQEKEGGGGKKPEFGWDIAANEETAHAS